MTNFASLGNLNLYTSAHITPNNVVDSAKNMLYGPIGCNKCAIKSPVKPTIAAGNIPKYIPVKKQIAIVNDAELLPDSGIVNQFVTMLNAVSIAILVSLNVLFINNFFTNFNGCIIMQL